MNPGLVTDPRFALNAGVLYVLKCTLEILERVKHNKAEQELERELGINNLVYA